MTLILFSIPLTSIPNALLKKATFGMGCFWCSEAVFQRLTGVIDVKSGYEGGHVQNPTYKQVCAGNTNHAEVIELTYDPAKISYEELLEVFWKTHDPTTLNRQGADVGSQYRSVIFYHDNQQKKIAEKHITQLNEKNIFGKPVVTALEMAQPFYAAENYHQYYYMKNEQAPFCQAVIRPKIEKLEKLFKEKIKY